MAAQDGSEAGELDPLTKDGKELAYSGCSAALPFALVILLLLPLWLGLLLPMALLWQLLACPFRLCRKPPPPFTPPPAAPVADRPKDQLDIVVFGAPVPTSPRPPGDPPVIPGRLALSWQAPPALPAGSRPSTSPRTTPTPPPPPSSGPSPAAAAQPWRPSAPS